MIYKYVYIKICKYVKMLSGIALSSKLHSWLLETVGVVVLKDRP